MQEQLERNQIFIKGNTGTAYLGELNDIIDNCVLPSAITQNLGFAPDAKVYHEGEEVGHLTDAKIKGIQIFYFVRFHKKFANGIYWCSFNINKMFSIKAEKKYILEQVVINNINVKKPIN